MLILSCLCLSGRALLARLVAARSRVARAIRVLPTAVRGPVLNPVAICRGTAGLSDDPQHPIATSLKFIRHFDDVNP
jgi:hypothetical protein